MKSTFEQRMDHYGDDVAITERIIQMWRGWSMHAEGTETMVSSIE